MLSDQEENVPEAGKNHGEGPNRVRRKEIKIGTRREIEIVIANGIETGMKKK